MTMNMHKTVSDFIYEAFMHGSPPLDFHTFFIEFLSDTHESLTDTVLFTFRIMDSVPYTLNPTYQNKDEAIVTLFDQCELYNKHVSYVEYKGHDMMDFDGRWRDVVAVYLVTNKLKEN
jgi:hypothetical protein